VARKDRRTRRGDARPGEVPAGIQRLGYTPRGYTMPATPMANLRLQLEGMTCSACVEHVRQALSNIVSLRVRNVAVGTAEIDFDPARTSAARILSALDAAGYPAKAVEGPR
jgi:copper chaperone